MEIRGYLMPRPYLEHVGYWSRGLHWRPFANCLSGYLFPSTPRRIGWGISPNRVVVFGGKLCFLVLTAWGGDMPDLADVKLVIKKLLASEM